VYKLGIWEPYVVKTQTLKTAIESACLILRIDDVVSGTRKKKPQA
jgi:T-complex protein 1 subunit gamma